MAGVVVHVQQPEEEEVVEVGVTRQLQRPER